LTLAFANTEGQSLSLLTAWGEGDAFIAAVARSTIDGVSRRSSDAALIDHLIRNRHTSPFEFAGLSVDVTAPKYVAAQWMRHRTQAYQELSGRYTDLTHFTGWSPAAWRTQGDGPNRQVGDGDALNPVQAAAANAALHRAYDAARSAYDTLRGLGICREQARAVLPFGFLTRFRASANLHNWLHFLGLRLADDAQEEIQWHARHIRTIVREHWPQTLESWERHCRHAVTLSADEVPCVRTVRTPEHRSPSRQDEWTRKTERMWKDPLPRKGTP
jgi:thymidylate synthase (FAD)